MDSMTWYPLWQCIRTIDILPSSRPAVEGSGVCFGIIDSDSSPQLATLHGQAANIIRRINACVHEVARSLQSPFAWSSLQVNRNTISSWHRDGANIGPSMIFAVGSYTGGEFEIEGHSPFSILGRAAIIDGKCRHRAHPFQGERWSIIAFMHHRAAEVTPTQRADLLNLGFHVQAV